MRAFSPEKDNFILLRICPHKESKVEHFLGFNRPSSPPSSAAAVFVACIVRSSSPYLLLPMSLFWIKGGSITFGESLAIAAKLFCSAFVLIALMCLQVFCELPFPSTPRYIKLSKDGLIVRICELGCVGFERGRRRSSLLCSATTLPFHIRLQMPLHFESSLGIMFLRTSLSHSCVHVMLRFMSGFLGFTRFYELMNPVKRDYLDWQKKILFP